MISEFDIEFETNLEILRFLSEGSISLTDVDISCCFTGHRRIESKDVPFINAALKTEITKMILNGIRYYHCGGAVGFDTLAEKTVIKLRKDYPKIKLIIAAPYKGQSNSFGEKAKREYNEILAQADTVHYLSERYDKGCMYRRNRYMVDHSSHCISYLNKETGGTAYTVEYARKRGLNTINLVDLLQMQSKEVEMYSDVSR